MRLIIGLCSLGLGVIASVVVMTTNSIKAKCLAEQYKGHSSSMSTRDSHVRVITRPTLVQSILASLYLSFSSKAPLVDQEPVSPW